MGDALGNDDVYKLRLSCARKDSCLDALALGHHKNLTEDQKINFSIFLRRSFKRSISS